MECLLLYLDDLEDLVYAVALTAERLRRIAGRLLALLAVAAIQCAFVLLAYRHPVMGAALAALMAVTALLSSATAPVRPQTATETQQA